MIFSVRKLGAIAGLAYFACAMSACAPTVDRTTLREVARFQNVARAEYQSVWSSYRFASESAPAILTIVTPDTTARSAVAIGSSTTDTKGGASETDSSKGSGSASSGKGTLTTTAATGAGKAGTAIGATQIDSGKGSTGVSSAGSSGGTKAAIGSAGTGAEKGTSGSTAVTGSRATTTAVGSTKVIADKGTGGSDSARGSGTVDSSKGSIAMSSAKGTLEIDARVGQAQIDHARGSAQISVTRPEIEVKKFADKTHVLPGDPITFTITVTNNGAIDVEKIDVFDEFPSEVEFISITGGEMRANKKVATARYAGPLHPGESASFSVTTRTR